MTTYRLLLEKTNINGHEILLKSNEQEALHIDEKLNFVNKKWKNLIALLNEVKEKFAVSTAQISATSPTSPQHQHQRAGSLSSINKNDGRMSDEPNAYQFMTKKINEHNEWLAKFNDLFIKEISPVDQLENERLLFELNVKKA